MIEIPCHSGRLAWLVALAIVTFASPVWALPFDGQPKVLLHLSQPTGKNACGRGELIDCTTASVRGNLNVPYFAYLLVARGDLANVAGLECGIQYQGGIAEGKLDHVGVDIFNWQTCASLDLPSPGPRIWPQSGGGDLISWDTTTSCQAGETAVAGYFYLTAYSPDVVEVTLRPSSGAATIATCAAMERGLMPDDLGRIKFSAGAAQSGCNPCVEECIPAISPICTVTSSLNFGNVTVGQTSTRSFTIANSGGGWLTGSVTESCADFQIIGVTSYTLFAGQSRSFQVSFSPATSGTKSCSITTSCTQIGATGTGVAPPVSVVCKIFPQSLDFRYVAVGESRDLTFAIINGGATPFSTNLRFSRFSLPDDCPQFSIIGPTNFVVAPHDSEFVTVRFTPGQEELSDCFLKGTGCQYLEVHGTSIPVEGCRAYPISLDFGELQMNQSAYRTFYVTNIGASPVSGLISNCPPDFNVVEDPSYSLAPGQSKTFTVQFSSTEPGPHYCNVETGCLNHVAVAGYVTYPPTAVCAITPERLEFNYVAPGDSAYLPFSIYNSGNQLLSGRAASNSADFHLVGQDSFDLAPTETHTMLVVFTPTSASLQVGEIEIGGCRPLSCFGNTMTLPVVSPDRLDFGSVAVGDSASLPFTLTNNTAIPLIGSAGEECSDFVVSPPEFALAPGEMMGFLVLFRPSQNVVQRCTMRPAPGVTLDCFANAVVAVHSTTWSAIKTRFK